MAKERQVPDLKTVLDWQARIAALINDRLAVKIPPLSVLRDVQMFARGIFEDVAHEDKELFSQIAAFSQHMNRYDLNAIMQRDSTTRANLRKVFWDALTQAKARVDERVAQTQQKAGVPYIPYYGQPQPENRKQTVAPAVPGRYYQPSLQDSITALNAQLTEERVKTQSVEAERDRLIEERDAYLDQTNKTAQLTKERDDFAIKLQAAQQRQIKLHEEYTQRLKKQDAFLEELRSLTLQRDEAVATLEQTRQALKEEIAKREESVKKQEAVETQLRERLAQLERERDDLLELVEMESAANREPDRLLKESETARQQLEADLDAAQRRVTQLEQFLRQRQDTLIHDIVKAAQPRPDAAEA